MAIKKIGNLNKHENPSQNKEPFGVEEYLNANWNKIINVVDNNADELSTIITENETNKQDISNIKAEQTEQNTKINTLEKDNTANKQDISSIQKKNTEQDTNIQNNTQSIEELSKENTELKVECERLRKDIDNSIPTISGKGEIVTLKGTSESRFKKLKIFGNSKQETRSGKNKLKLKQQETTNLGLTFNISEDEVKISGTATDTSAVTDIIECEIAPGEYKFISGSNSNSVGFTVRLYNSENTVVAHINDNNIVDIKEKVTKFRLVAINTVVGQTYNIVMKPMLLLSTETDDTYEQFGAMPSTNYPSENKNCEGNLNLTICNKNILNQNIPLVQGNYDNDGNKISNSDKRIEEYIKLWKGNFVLWAKNNIWINLFIYNKNKELINRINSNTNKLIKFSLNEDGYIRFAFNPVVDSLKDMQLEENSKATDYVEHQSQNFTFPLAEGKKIMENDYLADDGIHHNRKQYIFTGTETLYQDREMTNTFRYYTSSVVSAKSDYSICSHLKNAGSVNNINNVDEEAIYLINKTQFAFRLDKTIANTIAGVKTYLAEQYANGTPVVIEYESAEEEIETYNEEQQAVYNEIQNTAHSYEDTTHIFSTDETSAIFDVEARKDLQAENDNLQSQINEIKELLSTTATSAMLVNNLQTDLESEVL